MTGIRQTMALGFAVMFALELLKEETSILKSLVYVVIGITMHRSCLIILPMVLLYFFKKKLSISNVCLAMLPIVFVFRGTLTSMALSVFEAIGFELDTYSGSSGGMTTLLVYFLLLVWGIFLHIKEKRQTNCHPQFCQLWELLRCCKFLCL